MSRTRISQCSRQLIPLASAIILISCKLLGSEVEVEVEVDAGHDFTINLKNKSDDLLVVDDRLLGQGIETPIKVEVADQSGAIIPPCGYIDYVATGELLSVVPNGEAMVSIPVSAVTLTHCLQINERYMFRAALVSRGEIVSRADWVPFRAVSPLTEANQ